MLRDHARKEELRGDIVIDASGRSGRLDQQLRKRGADIRDEHHESGDVYFTRQYRLQPGQAYAPLHGLPAIITSDYTIGMLPADNGHFTITIAVWKDDPVLYDAVKDPQRFETFCRLIPRAAGWIDPAFAAPVNNIVYGFGALDSFWRSTVVNGKAQVHIEHNTYTFLVDPRANKTEIKEAVQTIWDVRVLSVNTLKRRGKMKRRGYTRGRRPDEKRAVVTLAQGDTIEIFEGGGA